MWSGKNLTRTGIKTHDVLIRFKIKSSADGTYKK